MTVTQTTIDAMRILHNAKVKARREGRISKNWVEIIDAYQGSVLLQTTKQAKKCGAFKQKEYNVQGEHHIDSCKTNPYFSRKMAEYAKNNPDEFKVDLNKIDVQYQVTTL